MRAKLRRAGVSCVSKGGQAHLLRWAVAVLGRIAMGDPRICHIFRLLPFIVLMSSFSCAHSSRLSSAHQDVAPPPVSGGDSEQIQQKRVRFGAAATRALVQVYDEDSDDRSLLLALMHQLDTDEDVAGPCSSWRDLLTQGLGRASHLARMAPQLRALRRAHHQAFIDLLSGNLSGVDRPLCNQALGELAHDLASTPAFVVTVEPWGPITLAGLRRLCHARAPATAPQQVAAPSQSLVWPGHG